MCIRDSDWAARLRTTLEILHDDLWLPLLGVGLAGLWLNRPPTADDRRQPERQPTADGSRQLERRPTADGRPQREVTTGNWQLATASGSGRWSAVGRRLLIGLALTLARCV